jgi:metal-responsive CopG/Arc/MetJ family transcriptional regulator
MKTAISIPDETFTRVEQKVSDLGMSRSEFYTKAAQCYLEHLDASSLTTRIDEAISLIGPDDSGRAAVTAGRRWLVQDDDW